MVDGGWCMVHGAWWMTAWRSTSSVIFRRQQNDVLCSHLFRSMPSEELSRMAFWDAERNSQLQIA
jgi:hypothetical protein